ncbi:MAG: YigZ family protein [Flavobacteriales bacterium]|nr:YigZ family protein [Flavobacteriales bacterium]
MLHPDSSITRANDGGEPNSSAGKPILNQLRKFELTNVLVVVVRYFGGKKLGIPGLIRSYKNATKDSLQRSIIINKKIMEQYDIEFNQEEMSFVMSFIKNNNIEIYRNLYISKNKLTINVQKNKSIEMLRLFKEKKIKILYKKIV